MIAPDATDSGSGPLRSNAHRAWPACILLVEDHADTLDLMLRSFRRVYTGTVMAAHSCATARTVAAGATCDLDLVIGDIGLPDGDGLKLLVELKQAYGCKTVALTGFGMPNDLERSRQAGIDFHLTKPVGLDQIRNVLAALRP